MAFTLEEVREQKAEQAALFNTAEAKREQRRRKRVANRADRAEREVDNREFVRHEIQALVHVRDLETMALMLFSGQEIELDPLTAEPATIPLDKDRVAQLSACANIKLALLRKVLPDIKAVELTGAGGEELGSQRELAEMELRNRLREVLTRGAQPVLEQAAEEPTYDWLG